MHESSDSLTHPPAGISRRGSLLSISGAGLAALVGLPLLASAKNGRKKRRKKNRKKNKGQTEDRCPAQELACNDFFAAFCADVSEPEECRETLGACCAFLGECQATGFLDCFFGLLEPTGSR